MSLIIPTLSGASFMAQAGPLGPYAPIRYFLPYYDHRIDPFVHSTANTLELSAADPVSATSVIGEVIYNISALNAPSPGAYIYSVSDVENLVVGGDSLSLSGAGAHKIISGSSFDAISVVNLLDGTPLSDYIAGSSIVYQGGNWLVNDYFPIVGDNSNPYAISGDRNRFFRVQSYGPITSAAGGFARGLFKIRLPHGVGNFKFNKIALYAAKYFSNGTEDTSVEPVLFAIAVLKNPILKTTDSTNLNNFELDLEMQFFSQGVAGQISYLNNDYWNRFQGGLWADAPGGIAIGSLSAVPGSWQPGGRLSIAVGDNEKILVSGFSVKTPHIRLTNDANAQNYDFQYQHYNVDDHLVLKSSYNQTTFSVVTSGYDQQNFNTRPYSKIELTQFPVTDTTPGGLGLNQQALQFFSYSPLSGTHYSHIQTKFGGYVDEMTIRSNFVDLYHTRVSTGGSLASMVLGKDAADVFVSPNHFLTIHGGSLMAGNSVNRPILTISGESASSDPVLSANGWIAAAGLTISEYINIEYGALIGTDIDVARDILCGRSLYAEVGPNYIDNTTFNDRSTFIGTQHFTSNLSASPTADCYLGNTVNAGTFLCNGAIAVDGTATFSDSVYIALDGLCDGNFSVGGRIDGGSSIKAPSISATNGYNEYNRPVRMGIWSTDPQTALTAVGGGSIPGVDIDHDERTYTLIGNTMIFNVRLGFLATGTVTQIRIPLPNGVVASSSPSTVFVGSAKAKTATAITASSEAATMFEARCMIDSGSSYIVLARTYINPTDGVALDFTGGGGYDIAASITFPIVL